ncbi:MAG: hypothetical protein H8E55_68040 [Pelagibacterales bacterium]|nr:hypothetical protein [Pelagibacterales bacterium]
MNIKKNIHYTLKLLIAGCLSLLVSFIMGFKLLPTALVSIYSMSVVQSTIGKTLHNMFPVLKWIGFGIIIGVCASELFVLTKHISAELIWLYLAVIVIYGAIVIPINNVAMMSFVTAIFILSLDFMRCNTAFIEICYRFSYIITSLSIGLFVSYFIFPKHSGNEYITIMRNMLNEAETAFNSMINNLLQEDKNKSTDTDLYFKQIDNIRNKDYILHKTIAYAEHKIFINKGVNLNILHLGSSLLINHLSYLSRIIYDLKDFQTIKLKNNYIENKRLLIQELFDIWRLILTEKSSCTKLNLLINNCNIFSETEELKVSDDATLQSYSNSGYFSFAHGLQIFASDLKYYLLLILDEQSC